MVVLDVESIDLPKNTILGTQYLVSAVNFITFEEALTLEADRLRIYWKCSLVVGVADAHQIHL